MRVCEWQSTLSEIPRFRTVSILTIGETVNRFTPNLTVTVRDLEENETLSRHFDVSKMVDGPAIRVTSTQESDMGAKQVIRQKAEAITAGGVAIDQQSLFFVLPPKAVVVTLSAAQNTGRLYEAMLNEFVAAFRIVQTNE